MFSVASVVQQHVQFMFIFGNFELLMSNLHSIHMNFISDHFNFCFSQYHRSNEFNLELEICLNVENNCFQWISYPNRLSVNKNELFRHKQYEFDLWLIDFRIAAA